MIIIIVVVGGGDGRCGSILKIRKVKLKISIGLKE